jgi:hypothetical protein
LISRWLRNGRGAQQRTFARTKWDRRSADKTHHDG